MKGGRRWILWTVLAYSVILAAVCLGLISLYDGSRAHLDRAMGERLLAAANSLAATADAARIFGFTLGDSTAAGYLDSLAVAFGRIAGANELAEVTLTDTEGRVLVSTAAGLTPGRLNDYWNLDPRRSISPCRASPGPPSCIPWRTPTRSRPTRRCSCWIPF